MINFVSTENVGKTNAFLDELEDLLNRYNAWMHVEPRMVNDELWPVIEIQALEDIDDETSEVEWFVEAVSLWPGQIERVVDVEESW